MTLRYHTRSPSPFSAYPIPHFESAPRSHSRSSTWIPLNASPLQDRIFEEFNTLSVIYGEPSERFITHERAVQHQPATLNGRGSAVVAQAAVTTSAPPEPPTEEESEEESEEEDAPPTRAPPGAGEMRCASLHSFRVPLNLPLFCL